MEADPILQDKDRFLAFIPQINEYVQTFRMINRLWKGAITAGMIETGRMPEARLFTPLIRDMSATISKYEIIQQELVDTILAELVNKVVFEISDAAKFAINILKRNLFERTADVGYLATDGEIIGFLRQAQCLEGPAALKHKAGAVRERLGEYRHEYTVYHEIIILDTEGRVLANLDPDNRISASAGNLFAKTMALDLCNFPGQDRFLETFGPSNLIPGRSNALIYSQKIEDPESSAALGALCLCFDFEEEMAGIFRDLSQGNPDIIAAILDAGGRVISTSAPDQLPLSAKIPVAMDRDFGFVTLQGRDYLVSIRPTDGYQGFYGLSWYGLAMIEMGQAFAFDFDRPRFETDITRQIRNFSRELSLIKKKSDGVLADMRIDGINGVVQATKYRNKTFVEIMNYISAIASEIDTLFTSAMGDLQQIVAASLFNDLQFRGFQGNTIADRNLYERANDVCWWALTPLFRTGLARQGDLGLEKEEQAAITATLQYINDLYTPYLRLFLTDTQGRVIAASSPPAGLEEIPAQKGLSRNREILGTKMDDSWLKPILRLASSKDYGVSPFAPSLFYGDRPTYVYGTAIRDMSDPSRIVGTIQVVFDAEPQFKAMLTDILPKDRNQNRVEGSFGVFADRRKTVISSTLPDFSPGSRIPLPDHFFDRPNGERGAGIVSLGSRSYALGFQVSEGYREYKRMDGYVNDIICMVFIPV
nr:hypothetical protein [Desulfobacula sp.]